MVGTWGGAEVECGADVFEALLALVAPEVKRNRHAAR